MKKLLLLFMLLMPLMAIAQDKISVVTLKNGTQLNGVIKAIDPMDAMTIVIGGIETTIKMDDVAKVENESSANKNVPQLSYNAKLIVTDQDEYPDSFQINLFGTSIRMILVRGGDMNMGFDGKDSRDMNSEPVHRVSVTSFYISDEFISTALATQLTDKKINMNWPYHEDKWTEIDLMIKKMSTEAKLPLRLPTEAEWEFAACSKKQDIIFGKCTNDEFCLDFYAEFENFLESTLDPTGPKTGRRHAVRYYGKGNKKFDRDHSDSKNHFRVAIKAVDVNKLLNNN